MRSWASGSAPGSRNGGSRGASVRSPRRPASPPSPTRPTGPRRSASFRPGGRRSAWGSRDSGGSACTRRSRTTCSSESSDRASPRRPWRRRSSETASRSDPAPRFPGSARTTCGSPSRGRRTSRSSSPRSRAGSSPDAPARRPPRELAELIVRHFPRLPAVGALEIAGPGFVNVTLAPDWCRAALPGIVAAGPSYGGGEAGRDQHVRLEFVSANPTGPLVIVNARAAAVGDALARLLKSQGYAVTTEFYVNDAGNQFQALAKSFEARVRQALGEDAPLPENGYPGDYLVDLARDYVKEGRPAALDLPESQRVEHLGGYAVARITEGQRRVLHDYGVDFDLWSSERRAV